MSLIYILEKKRIYNFNAKKSKKAIKHSIVLSGDYVILWYINREKEKGVLRFQFNKGICMNMHNRGYNSLFQLRSVIGGVAIEQQFFNYSSFNILMLLKKNPIPGVYKNCLKYLRGKKNFVSKFKVVTGVLY